MAISEWRKQLELGNVSSRELVDKHIARIEKIDNSLHSFLELTSERARFEADQIDEARRSGEKLPPLAGIPIAVKDNLCTKGVRTTCSSRMLEGFLPPYESTVTTKLWSSGAILLGKTNLDEFAMGSSTETSYFGATANPWSLEKVPGGSSGGSASAVASGECLASIGSDTGGSIRQPASFCGVVGLKPTYGRVSRWGLIAFASSLDQIGPFANSVEDVAEILKVISGEDPLDSTSLKSPVPDYLSSLNSPIKGKRIGLIKECFEQKGLNSEVKDSVLAAASHLESLGAELVEISCERFNDGIATYYVIAPCEASANLARYDGVKYGYRSKEGDGLLEMMTRSRTEGFGSEVKRRILMGTYALSAGYVDAYYKQAQKVRTLICQDFKEAFKRVDLLLTPTSPTTAFKAGTHTEDPVSMYLSDLLTIPANLAGLPAISLPCGFDSSAMPIGLQLIGNVLDESSILNVAHQYEVTANVMKGRPPGDLIP